MTLPKGRPGVGRLGALQKIRSDGAHDVRPDDGGLVDLHRDTGDPPGHLRDVRGLRAEVLWGNARRTPGSLRGAWRDGWSPAARGHAELGRRALRRDRSRTDRAAGAPPPPPPGCVLAPRGPPLGGGGAGGARRAPRPPPPAPRG